MKYKIVWHTRDQELIRQIKKNLRIAGGITINRESFVDVSDEEVKRWFEIYMGGGLISIRKIL